MKGQWMRRWQWLLLLVLVWQPGPGLCFAAAHNGQMRLTIDARGNVSAYLVVFVLPENPRILEGAVQEALGVRLRDVEWDIDDHKHVVSMYAHSAEPYSHSLWHVRGQITLEHLRELLHRLGLTALSVNLNHPRCGFSSVAAAGQPLKPQLSWNTEYAWEILLDEGPAPPLSVEFGYRPQDVMRIGGTILAVLLLSLIVPLRHRLMAPGVEQAGSTLVPVRRSLFLYVALLWAASVVGIYLLRADVLVWFVANTESDLGQMALLTGVLWIVPIVPALVGYQPWRMPGKDSQQPSPTEPLSRFMARWHGTLIIPTALVAIGIVDLRDMDLTRAGQWLVLGACSALVAVFGFIWTNASKLGLSPQSSAPGEARDWLRLTVFRRICGEFIALICFPAAILWLLRQARLEDVTRYAVLFLVLVLVGLLLVVLSHVLPHVGVRRMQSVLDGQLALEGANSAVPGAEFVVVAATGVASDRQTMRGGQFAYCWPTESALCFSGTDARFKVGRGQIRSIELQRSSLGWWQGQAVSVIYSNSQGTENRLELYPAGVRSSFSTRVAARRLHERLDQWWKQPEAVSAAALELAEFGPPPLTSVSLASSGRHRTWAVVMILIVLLLAYAASVLLQFPFDLTQGDEGWAMLLIVGTAALFYWAPQLRAR